MSYFIQWLTAATMTQTLASQKQQIRLKLRAKRTALSFDEHKRLSSLCCENAFSLLNSSQPNKIALYLSHDGELNPQALIQYCWDNHHLVYLPVLDKRHKQQLLFVLFESQTPLIKNKYGISEPEPNPNNTIVVAALDIIFIPLVAFTENGGRLGMGGGYYDRTLCQLLRPKATPQLIGLAYDFQKLATLPAEPWDIMLNRVVTPKR